MEIWKPINEKYEVSNLGNVRSISRVYTYKRKNILITRKQNSVTLKPGDNGKGYLKVHLGGKNGQKYIHRLVAEAFLENPMNKKQVNHINGNKKDNRLENLEWVTNQENRDHAVKRNLHSQGDLHPQSKLNSYIVKYAIDNYIPGHEKFGCSALARKFGVSQSVMNNAINKKTWKRV